MDFTPPKTPIAVEMPSNFISVILDFTNDLSTTFPEYSYLWCKWTSKETTIKEYEELFLFCMKTYPERFFDILYQNDEIFDSASEVSTQFLPNVEFKILFTCDNITPTIKQTIWKYLQLVLMTIMSSVKEKADFGDAANIFDGIDEDELQGKLNDTIQSLGNFFKTMENQDNSVDDTTGQDGIPNLDTFAKMFEGYQEGNSSRNPSTDEGNSSSNPSTDEGNSSNNPSTDEGNGNGKGNIPSADDINDHLKGIFNGKIGSLAKELADELSGDIMGMLDGEEANIKDTGDIFKKLMKNPKKIIDLLKSISGKLTTKMKSGNISQEELMKEAGDLIGKMKGMGGGSEFSDIIKNLTKNMAGMGGGKGKMDMNAITRMSSQQSMRERMKAKLEQKKQAACMQSKTTPEFVLETTDKPNNFVFKMTQDDEPVEKSVSKPNKKKKNKK